MIARSRFLFALILTVSALGACGDRDSRKGGAGDTLGVKPATMDPAAERVALADVDSRWLVMERR